METTIQHIELINLYLNNLLSREEKSNFIQKLENDSEFNHLYQEHVIIVEGINRVALKLDIAKARKSYSTNKWIRISTIGIVVIGTLFLLYMLLFKTTNSEPNGTIKEGNPTVIQFDNNQSKNKAVTTDSIVTSDFKLPAINSDSVIHNKVNKPFDAFEKQPQTLSFDTRKDTVIKCKEGTVLKIKANTFVYSGTQKAVSGKVDIEVTEYYKLADMLLANLTTTSKGQQLETGGMLYLEAFQGDALVELKNDTTIEIAFPTKNKKEGMQLFSGLEGESGIDWILDTNELEVLNTSEEMIEVPFSLVEEVPVFPGCETVDEGQRRQCFNDGMNRFLQRNFNTDIFIQLGLTGKQRVTSTFKINEKGDIQFVQSNAVRPELINEANRVIALLPRMKPGKQRGRNVTVPYSIPIMFQIQDNTASKTETIVKRDSIRTTNTIFVNNVIVYDTITSLSRGMVERIREVMHDADFDVDPIFIQQWDYFRNNNMIREINKSTSDRKFLIRKQVFETKDSRFKILEDDSITRGGHVIRIPWGESKVPTTTNIVQIVPRQTYYAGNEALTAEEFENRVKDGEKTKSITTRDVNNYILKTSKLGWINCDRFINGRTKRIKYKLKIKNSDNTIVNMVFKSVNSILPSWKSNDEFDFGTVADAMDVVLVAIKKEDGKLFLDIVDTKTNPNPKVDFEFKEVTLQEMKSELKKMNKLFD